MTVLTLALLAGYFSQPLVHGNQELVDLIAGAFSILAGFTVAVMILSDEPVPFRVITWRTIAVTRRNVHRRLIREKWLVILYLMIVGASFISTLLTRASPDHCSVIWFERVYLTMACLAFLVTLTLPGRLVSRQLARFDEIVEMQKTTKAHSLNTDARNRQ